jgi:hypothetical protein
VRSGSGDSKRCHREGSSEVLDTENFETEGKKANEERKNCRCGGV